MTPRWKLTVQLWENTAIVQNRGLLSQRNDEVRSVEGVPYRRPGGHLSRIVEGALKEGKAPAGTVAGDLQGEVSTRIGKGVRDTAGGSGIDSVVPPGGGEKEVPEIIAAIGACQNLNIQKHLIFSQKIWEKIYATFLYFFTDQDQGHLKGNPDLWIIDHSWMLLWAWWILHLLQPPNYFKRFDKILKGKKSTCNILRNSDIFDTTFLQSPFKKQRRIMWWHIIKVFSVILFLGKRNKFEWNKYLKYWYCFLKK